jgi:hypothetical protein
MTSWLAVSSPSFAQPSGLAGVEPLPVFHTACVSRFRGPAYYFCIIDLSVCLPIITALQLRCEISSLSYTFGDEEHRGRFANGEETHD